MQQASEYNGPIRRSHVFWFWRFKKRQCELTYRGKRITGDGEITQDVGTWKLTPFCFLLVAYYDHKYKKKIWLVHRRPLNYEIFIMLNHTTRLSKQFILTSSSRIKYLFQWSSDLIIKNKCYMRWERCSLWPWWRLGLWKEGLFSIVERIGFIFKMFILLYNTSYFWNSYIGFLCFRTCV